MNYGRPERIICQTEDKLAWQLFIRAGQSNVQFLHNAYSDLKHEACALQKEFAAQLEEEKRLNAAILESLGKVKI